MGTEVGRKSCFPGYLQMMNLNEDTTNKWDPFNEGVVNGQMYNGLMSSTINGFSEYYKALLRQTMLRHNQIFKKQVVELHRLYRVQKDLMLELKRKEERLIPPLVQSTPPSLVSTHNLQCGMENSNGSDSSSAISKPTKIFKRQIDLHLPADAYLELDDAECQEDYIIRPHHQNGNFRLEPERDVNLTLGTYTNGSTENERAYANQLADLNETLDEALCEELLIPCKGLEEHKKRHHDKFSGFLKFEKDLCLSSNKSGNGIAKSSGFWVSSLSTGYKRESKIQQSSEIRELFHLSSNNAKASPLIPHLPSSNFQNSIFDQLGLTSQNTKVVKSVDLNLAPPNGFHCVFDSPKEWKIAQGQSPTASSFCQSNSEVTPRIGNPEAFNGFDGRINLNFAPTNLYPSGYIKSTSTRFVTEIDLEAPLVPPPEEDQAPSGESEMEDAPAKAAAETIQMMSLAKPPNSSAAALLLLADVISSCPDEMGKISDVKGMDYFEYKALELKETKMDRLCSNFKPFNRDDGCPEEGVQQRSPARRRRQKRDFRKEVLPALSSLSRHEVTEDLQLFGDLMRASGLRWQPPRGMSVLGWGRTTRRARRQRSSGGNPVFQPIA